MPDINIRGELWDNDSADILRWWGWRDLTAPGDIAAALAEAGDEPVTVVVNSPGGDMAVGGEIRSMLRRHAPGATALIQGHCASARRRRIRLRVCGQDCACLPDINEKG